ncbi:MAG: sugar phosphate isomerase/epimerase family protein [Bryobacteraceae bacterium]
MTRRHLLLGAGAAALAPSLPAFAPDWKAKAKRNLKLGVFSHLYSRLPVAEAASRMRADGFHSTVLEYQFADVRFDPLAPDWNAAAKITAALGKAQLRVAALSGYYNIVDPDLARRQHGEERIRALMTNWKHLGSPLVCTETGTLNTKSEWVESPDNYTEAAYGKCRDVIASLAKHAAGSGCTLAIEVYWRNVIDSAARAERLFKDVASPSLQLVMDPCNYYRNEDLSKVAPVLRDLFRRVGSHTVIAHAKDVKATPTGQDLPAAGLGVMDYPVFLGLLARLDKPLDLIIEHLELDDVPRARDYVLAQFDKIV